jgi:N-acetylglucosaminyl-diphospho-decaprenol L-rhamnosyltransferase
MILSVIIVNYNVKYFLEQCLYSVESALRELDRQPGIGGFSPETAGPEIMGQETEIFVVDNHSSDGSIEYLRPKFPRVRFLVNEENLGFARANNQALREAGGKHILFLNPDTILPEDYFRVCLSFMEANPGAGAAGVRMIDGSGRFLKESRRGFPSPWVAFCKLTGLTALFPHSRLLAKYYLGHLSSTGNHPAPILSGACLWVRKDVLDRAGSFDEQFFMYAEDIDLSYRIEQAGYTNYYIADTTILHFKGESTQKDIRYVKLFYKAMSQFRRKHFSGGLSALFNVLMEIAIWLRAGVTAMANLFKPPSRPGERLSYGSGNGSHLAKVGNMPPGRGQENAGPHRIKTGVMGDPAGAARLTAYLSSQGDRSLMSDLQQADEIIFCEGPAFSFSDCIAALQKSRQGRAFKIHAGGSDSAVGSHSKEERGQTIVLPINPGSSQPSAHS